jgi:hypothetical protein
MLVQSVMQLTSYLLISRYLYRQGLLGARRRVGFGAFVHL